LARVLGIDNVREVILFLKRLLFMEQKTAALVRIIAGAYSKILVVGCGTGAEAGILCRAFHAETIGIDLGGQFAFDHAGAAPATLMQMDATQLAFEDASFDLVFSFHALEHIHPHKAALKEMARVLRSGGTYLIGTPNKSRILGYIGSAASLRNKIAWNVADLKRRLQGTWSNDSGAHAGFTESELLSLCSEAFGNGARCISDEYYSELYRTTLLRQLPFARRAIYPCTYVTGTKG
jgi:SAM-dependent methyltransferase